MRFAPRTPCKLVITALAAVAYVLAAGAAGAAGANSAGVTNSAGAAGANSAGVTNSAGAVDPNEIGARLSDGRLLGLSPKYELDRGIVWSEPSPPASGTFEIGCDVLPIDEQLGIQTTFEGGDCIPGNPGEAGNLLGFAVPRDNTIDDAQIVGIKVYFATVDTSDARANLYIWDDVGGLPDDACGNERFKLIDATIPEDSTFTTYTVDPPVPMSQGERLWVGVVYPFAIPFGPIWYLGREDGPNLPGQSYVNITGDHGDWFDLAFIPPPGPFGQCFAVRLILEPANEAPTAAAGGPYAGNEGELIVFDGSGSSDPDGDPLTYLWDFGDGMSDSGVTPSHVYTTGGTYTVTLTVTDPGGSSDDDATTAEINGAPTAVSGGPYAANEGELVAFAYGSGSTDPDLDPLTYAWEFGDGTSDTGVSPTHVYAVGGVYQVTLTVRDPGGLTGEDATTADINAAPMANAGGPYAGNEGELISFDGTASSDPEGDPLTFTWDFGDGDQGAGATPTHTYELGGTYTVTLIVTDPGDLRGDDATHADINGTPVADAGGPYTGSEGVAAQLDGTASDDPDGDSLTYSWDFGDGSSASGATPVHTWSTGGTYTVTLTVADPGGLTSDAATTAGINGAPRADAGGPYAANVGELVQFDGSASFDPELGELTYEWDFGDGATSTGVSPTHAYLFGGTHVVTLTVTDIGGLADDDATVAAVNTAPISDPGPGYAGVATETMAFDGSASFDPDGDPLTYLWDFGDGSTDTGVAPSHVYALGGAYGVRLTVTDPGGLTDSMTTTAEAHIDTVRALPVEACLNLTENCEIVPVVLSHVFAGEVRGISVTFSAAPELVICGAADIAIQQGDWLSEIQSVSFSAKDNEDETYTVDYEILGQPSCGVTYGGTVFTVALRRAPGVTQGTGGVAISRISINDCAGPLGVEYESIAGPPPPIVIDAVPPPPVTGISVAPVTSGNDGDGTLPITVGFDPVDPEVVAVEVWRAAFGNYPEYDDAPGAGSTPILPIRYPPSIDDSRWELTSLTQSGENDEPRDRDFWHYIAIARDACGNPAAPLAMDAALNYQLGDIAPVATPGNNQVNFLDLSQLAGCYFRELAPNDDCGAADVGPVLLSGRPATDDSIDFEDLLVFAENFEQVSLIGPGDRPAIVTGGAPELTLRIEDTGGGRAVASLELESNPGRLRGLHATLAITGARLESVERGELLDRQAGQVFFADDGGAPVVIDMATLGRGVALSGRGELARLILVGDDAGVRIVDADFRDLGSAVIDADTRGAAVLGVIGATAPARFELLGARPNPFRTESHISFRLPVAGHVDVRIYDAQGSLVRALVDGVLPLGEHGIVWDGRTERGTRAGSGVYFYRVETGGFHAVDKLLLLK